MNRDNAPSGPPPFGAGGVALADVAAAPDSYVLLDVGDGRRVERFGDLIIDRPAPQARQPRRDPGRWGSAAARFERGVGWTTTAPVPEPWVVTLDGLTYHLRLTDSGQVGLYPEQAPNWAWIRDRVTAMTTSRTGRETRPRVLDLFAHTGGSTLAAAAAGAEVVHVDAVRSALGWARENAAASGLSSAPIRWIPDDAVRFTERELCRGRTYDLIVLDPPSYGHGPGGERWALTERLPYLLGACAGLLAPEPVGLLLSAHTTGLAREELAAAVRSAVGGSGRIETVSLTLDAASGARLDCGVAARWTP